MWKTGRKMDLQTRSGPKGGVSMLKAAFRIRVKVWLLLEELPALGRSRGEGAVPGALAISGNLDPRPPHDASRAGAETGRQRALCRHGELTSEPQNPAQFRRSGCPVERGHFELNLFLCLETK